ncbi:hypothetical protein F0562_024016 [Nyssa sinensis]|uniref:DUF7036 domain-containing protein n=1 Tax=Nyssa sinensis TaxID=561372 RepID=A0A5J5BJF6_9ASTE|nr:hypothetical protein F0562_024016 [Nyssa sinensis]
MLGQLGCFWNRENGSAVTAGRGSLGATDFGNLQQAQLLQNLMSSEEMAVAMTAAAYFRLQKPFSVLVAHTARLEYDIYGEISVSFTMVAIPSMHRAGASNWTDVVFGVLSDPMDVSINSVYLSVLKLGLRLRPYEV